MSVINFSDGGNITSIGGLIGHSNELTGGSFGVVIVIAVGIISIMATGNKYKGQSFALSSLLMWITSIFMWMLNACALDTVFVTSALLGLTVLVLYIDKGGA